MSVALTQFRRAQLEARIEDLIALLDLLDDDCDLEECGDDEPSLGGSMLCGPNGVECDLEFNGDEQDYNGDEGDHSVGRLDGGAGL